MSSTLVLSLDKDGRYPTLVRSLLGHEALSLPPFTGKRRGEGRRQAADEEEDAGPEPAAEPAEEPYAARFDLRLCQACASRAPLERGALSLRHLATSCRHRSLLAWRAQMLASLPALLNSLVKGATEAMDADPWAPKGWSWAHPPRKLAVEALMASPPAPPLSAEHRLLIHRLLLAAPWSASHAGTGNRALAGLGELFDTLNVKPHLLRTWASTWLQWAERQLCGLAAAYREALEEEA